MFCIQCGNATTENAKFCGKCGIVLQVTSHFSEPVARVAPPQIPMAEHCVLQIRPWVRYWARMFDIYLACVIGGLAIGILNPEALNEKGSTQLFGIAVIFAWVFVESLLLSAIGTTPGKWLFKTRIVPSSGNKLDFPSALSRSIKVWWRGLGIGFPIASLITLIGAHGKLTKNGVTTWDRDGGFTIVHDRIGPLRLIAAVLFFLGFLVLVAIGSSANV